MNRPEQELQIACVKHVLEPLEGAGELLFLHVANQGRIRGGWLVGKILKAMGLRAGFPDLIILWRDLKNHKYFEEKVSKAGFIEMKPPVKIGKRGEPLKGPGLSNEQKWWRYRLQMLGFNYAVCRSQGEMTSILEEWGVI